MKVLVDKLPTKPHKCLFCYFPNRSAIESGIHGNCIFHTRLENDTADDYSYGFGRGTCFLYVENGECPYLKEV